MQLLWKIFVSLWIIAGIFIAGSLLIAFLPLATLAGAALLVSIFTFFVREMQPVGIQIVAAVTIFVSILALSGSAVILLTLKLIVMWWPKRTPEALPPAG